MTIIAYDGIVVAADTLITAEDGMRGKTRKLAIFGTQVLATTGAADHGEALIIWFKDGKKPSAFPTAQTGDKNAYLYVFEYLKPVMCFQMWPAPVIFPMDEFAAGCGRDIARAAMEMGASAIAACQLAIKLNVFCGGPVEYVDLQALTEDGKADVLTYAA